VGAPSISQFARIGYRYLFELLNGRVILSVKIKGYLPSPKAARVTMCSSHADNEPQLVISCLRPAVVSWGNVRISDTRSCCA